MAKRKPDWYEIELLEGRGTRIRFQLQTLDFIKDYFATKARHPSNGYGYGFNQSVGLKGLAVMVTRIETGRLYTEDQVERHTKFIEGMVDLGILRIEPSKFLNQESQKSEYRTVFLDTDNFEDAKTRINNQR